MSLQEQVMEEMWADKRTRECEQLMKDWKNAAVKADDVMIEAYELRMERAIPLSPHRRFAERANTQEEIELLAKMNAAARALHCQNHRASNAGFWETNPIEMSGSWKIHHELLEVGVKIFRSGLCWQEAPERIYNLVSGVRPDEYTYTSAANAYDRSREGIKQRAEFEREMRFANSWVLPW